MKELIEALQIFLKYGDVRYPTHCEHDVMYVIGYDPAKMEAEDVQALERLGFNYSTETDHADAAFYSFKYGSC